MRPNLWQLSETFRQLAATLDGDELPDDLGATIDALNAALPLRVRDSIALRDMLRDEAETLKRRAADFEALAKRRLCVADTIAADVLRVMQSAGVEKLETDLGKVSVAPSSRPTIRWEGEGDVPEAFTRTKVEFDSAKALEAYKAGTLPAGFRAARTPYLKVT